jgi:hypothetical protein
MDLRKEIAGAKLDTASLEFSIWQCKGFAEEYTVQ